MRTDKILVVCHGNINRSPLCGYILQTLLPQAEVRQAAMKHVERPERATKKVRDFAGGSALMGAINCEEGVSEQWRRVAGLLDRHRSRQCTAEDLDWAQLVVYMDGGNLRRIEDLARSARLVKSGGAPWTVCLASHLSPPQSRIADPAFMRAGSDELSNTLQSIVRASQALAGHIRNGGPQ